MLMTLVLFYKTKKFTLGKRFQLPDGIESEETRKRKRGKRVSDVSTLEDIAKYCQKLGMGT
jgi:hypothetical protein